MSIGSIYNVIRSAKVTTGNADIFQSMRTFDATAQVCPDRANVSDSGVVGVSRDTIQTYAAGCFNPLDRITVENALRPDYSYYLNASAINMPGVGDDAQAAPMEEYQSKPFYDTQLGYQYVRPVQSMQAMYPTQPLSQFTAVGPVSAQDVEENTINCIMNRTYENRNCDGSQ